MESTSCHDGDSSIIFLKTGTVQIKTVMYTQPATRSHIFRRLNLLTSNEWTDPLPIGAFLIRHASGPWLFDTGESICCNSPGYFPAWTRPIQSLSKTCITPDDSIVNQLKIQGVAPKDLKGIIISHLHRDHAGGLEELATEAPEVPIYVGKSHWEAFGNQFMKASLGGCAPGHWPESFPPCLLEPKAESLGPWKTSCSLTEDRAIVAVDTPGHVPGHLSLVVRCQEDDGLSTTYFLTGDATYSMDLLQREETDGVSDDPIRALESLRKIKEFARRERVVVLPSHDVDTPRLLAEKVVYNPV